MGRIETFYRKNFKRLTGFIKEYTDGSYEIASDIVQMVFLRLLELESEGRTNFYEETPLTFFMSIDPVSIPPSNIREQRRESTRYL